MMDFDVPRRSRRPDLTPMIDVVFLLLVFFMLASRFITDTTIPLATAAREGTTTEVTFRLVELGPDGALTLNGRPIAPDDLPAALHALSEAPEAPVILRGRKAVLQDLVAVMDGLRAAGFTRLVLVE